MQWQADAAYTDSLTGLPERDISANYETPFKVVFAYPGIQPGATLIALCCFDVAVSFPANFSGSKGFCGTNPTATATYTVKKNSGGTVTTIGTVAISTGGAFTFASTGGTLQSFAAGDVLLILTPASDATLADVAMTLAGYRT